MVMIKLIQFLSVNTRLIISLNGDELFPSSSKRVLNSIISLGSRIEYLYGITNIRRSTLSMTVIERYAQGEDSPPNMASVIGITTPLIIDPIAFSIVKKAPYFTRCSLSLNISTVNPLLLNSNNV